MCVFNYAAMTVVNEAICQVLTEVKVKSSCGSFAYKSPKI